MILSWCQNAMITREADYAIRVMMLLARRECEDKAGASSQEIAKEMDIPYRFLRKLVKRMVAGGLVESRRGKGGGLALRKPAGEISVFDVLQVMGPSGTQLSQCLTDESDCRRSGTCGMHRAIRRIQAGVDRELRAASIASLAGESSGCMTKKQK
jgi:Rrf2 family iron-sulfur cluster assembly transcriptional regulator